MKKWIGPCLLLPRPSSQVSFLEGLFVVESVTRHEASVQFTAYSTVLNPSTGRPSTNRPTIRPFPFVSRFSLLPPPRFFYASKPTNRASITPLPLPARLIFLRSARETGGEAVSRIERLEALLLFARPRY